MKRNIIVAAVSVVIVALGILFQVTMATSHEEKDGGDHEQNVQTSSSPAPHPTPTTTTPATMPTDDTTGEQKTGEERNDQNGKPGETKE